MRLHAIACDCMRLHARRAHRLDLSLATELISRLCHLVLGQHQVLGIPSYLEMARREGIIRVVRGETGGGLDGWSGVRRVGG